MHYEINLIIRFKQKYLQDLYMKFLYRIITKANIFHISFKNILRLLNAEKYTLTCIYL